ncbi:hypothetical protein CLV91_3101 [Maribacter vaceletii]|uniref:Lipocalin-like protein n=1 Tax=Maribacter vaceletii TaxID=1206816 RepID=A0A495DSK9_9FLAO|nr:hypothetical protein [Maribacter vaceletii]RKR07116.1 hypothetical protein CLV91_3101 [Maribacter vaceletii]
MLKTLVILSSLCFISCSSKIEKEDLKNLNGYWEIQKVTFKDGTSKEYKMSTTLDYIHVLDSTGYRKKVQPKFNGTYQTSNDAETFSITEENANFFLNYSSNTVSKRKEKVVTLNKKTLSVVNEKEIMYTYKKFTPINITK